MSSEAPGGAPRGEDERRLESSRDRTLLELAALDKSDFDGVLRTILTADARELGVERVNCWTVEDRRIQCVTGYLQSSDSFEAGTIIEATQAPAYFRALTDNPVILADDARTDPRTREFTDGYLVPLGITSMMDVPIWVRGRLWGVVCHEHVGPARRWTDAERNFAISIGHIVSMAVEAGERADAERIARFSEFFTGVLSHDLRTPLATIRVAADLLREGETDITRRNATQKIMRNTELMSRMIEQLLDFTRIRVGGGMAMKCALANVADLAKCVVTDLPTDVASRVDFDARGHSIGYYDTDRIWQAVSNLVANALQHGSPTGRVRVVVDGTEADKVIVKVINAGAIPADLLRVVFDPFQRPHTRASSHKSGLGLGLFIVREIVAAHDGTIAVASNAGEVTFTMTLPRRLPQV
ncbi:MAG TPA: GAF domain-containing sensor histidine kinase [Kofleriaceae bacterium]